MFEVLLVTCLKSNSIPGLEVAFWPTRQVESCDKIQLVPYSLYTTSPLQYGNAKIIQRFVLIHGKV